MHAHERRACAAVCGVPRGAAEPSELGPESTSEPKGRAQGGRVEVQRVRGGGDAARLLELPVLRERQGDVVERRAPCWILDSKISWFMWHTLLPDR